LFQNQPGFETSSINYNFNRIIIFCSKGGKIKDRGSDARNPAPQPANQAAQKAPLNPTLMAVITKDMHMDMIVAMQRPKNTI
jgi:hypothetical protein